MTSSEELEFAQKIHQRLLDNDPVAPAELVEAYLEPLMRRLRRRFPEVQDETLICDAATDALLDYAEHPSRFDSAQSKLLTYLTMVARGDLLNALDKEGRRKKREVSFEVVEQSDRGRNILQEYSETPLLEDQGVGQNLMRQLLEVIPEPCDREFLQLMQDGERKTSAYAALLGIQDRDESEQRKIVKRHKDRLNKRLERLGVKLRGEKF